AIEATVLPVLQKFNDVVIKLVKWFADLSPNVQKTITVIAGIVAAVGPVLVVFGSLAKSIGALLPLFGSVGKAIALLSNPIGIAIAAITALVAAGVYVYKNWDKVSATASSVWDAITNIISNSVQRIIGILQNLKHINIVQVGKDIINCLNNGILSKIKIVKVAALSVASGVKNAITGFFAIRSPSK